MKSKLCLLAFVAGGVLTAQVAAAGGQKTRTAQPPDNRPSASCRFSADSSELKIKNTASQGMLARGIIVNVEYKSAGGSVRKHEIKLSSDIKPGAEMSVKVPSPPAPGASCGIIIY